MFKIFCKHVYFVFKMRQNFDANGATALKKKNPLAIPQRAPPCPCRTRIDRSASSMVAPGNSNALSERRRTIACDLPTHPRLDFAEICERTGTTLCIAKTALCTEHRKYFKIKKKTRACRQIRADRCVCAATCDAIFKKKIGACAAIL
jgi:hypothetical protein